MIGNEAAIGVIYSGEAIYTQQENPNLEYVIPERGKQSSGSIPGLSRRMPEHKENAEKFIDFLCRADIALMNFEYITYSTPNTAARELIEDEEHPATPRSLSRIFPLYQIWKRFSILAQRTMRCIMNFGIK